MPMSREVVKALGQLMNGKVAGSSKLIPEMSNVGKKSSEFVGMLEKLVRST